MSDEQQGQDVQHHWLWRYSDPGIAKRSANISNDTTWRAEESFQSYFVPNLDPVHGRASNLRAIALWSVGWLTVPGGWLTLIHGLVGAFGTISYSIIGVGVLPIVLAIAFAVWVCRRDRATTSFVWIAGMLALVSIVFFGVHVIG